MPANEPWPCVDFKFNPDRQSWTFTEEDPEFTANRLQALNVANLIKLIKSMSREQANEFVDAMDCVYAKAFNQGPD